MQKILIPLDGSDLAEMALDPAIRLADRTEATVVLTAVVSDLPPVPLAAGDGELVSGWFQEEEERAQRYLEGIRKGILIKRPEMEVEIHVELGPVARTILAHAAESQVDLIALTSHGRGTWQRAWLGSVADEIIRKAHRPVLLLRKDDASRTLFEAADSPRRVLIPLDGSSAAEQVLDPLTPVLSGSGGRVTLVSVLLRPFPLASTYLPHAVEEGTLLEEREKRTRAYLEEVAKRWDPPGVTVDTAVIASDDVASALLTHAETHDVDLLALSTRGRGGVSRLLMGSVADKLVRGARLPVFAVRRPAE